MSHPDNHPVICFLMAERNCFKRSSAQYAAYNALIEAIKRSDIDLSAVIIEDYMYE